MMHLLFYSLNSLAAVTIDSNTGAMTVKSKIIFNLNYRDILSSANPGALFAGNDNAAESKRSTQFFALYISKDSNYASLSRITWNGNEFSTHRFFFITRKEYIIVSRNVKNPRISFIDDKFCQITYEDSARNVYRTVMVTFTSESDYTISTAVEGIHFAIGPLSPSSWNVMTPNNCLLGLCIPLLQSPNSLSFDMAVLSSPTNSFGVIGIAAEDGKNGAESCHWWSYSFGNLW